MCAWPQRYITEAGRSARVAQVPNSAPSGRDAANEIVLEDPSVS